MVSTFLIFPLLICIIVLVHLLIDRHHLNRIKILKIILIWSLIIGVGISGIYAFIGHTFFADEVARSIGWPVGNPFQQEVGLANLAFGILGLLCYKFRDNFWLATVIGWFIFMVGAGIGHIYQAMVHADYSPNNVGPILIYDLVFPVIVLILLLISIRLSDMSHEPPE